MEMSFNANKFTDNPAYFIIYNECIQETMYMYE